MKESYSETILLQDTRYQHFCCQMDRELLESLHGKANKHPGISQMLIEIRQKYYCPGIAKIVKKRVQGCESCIEDIRIPNSSITSLKNTDTSQTCKLQP